jgi:hypothetical protein|tara:strand:- start:191 stop:373 length:183 start_codon:yes stop_codon:yes gene_type:complete
MLLSMNKGNSDVHIVIQKLQAALEFLDENNFAVPAIKIDEAINALQQGTSDSSGTTIRDV